VAVDSDGHIYVVDADFDVVQIFDGSGRLLLAFGSSGTGKGELFLPAGIFIDENDKIYWQILQQDSNIPYLVEITGDVKQHNFSEFI
jgi:hypothetical protein